MKFFPRVYKFVQIFDFLDPEIGCFKVSKNTTIHERAKMLRYEYKHHHQHHMV